MSAILDSATVAAAITDCGRTTTPQAPVEADLDGRDGLVLSIVLPCLNEATTVTQCVQSALNALRSNAIDGEVIVVDNGSDDGSGELAEAAGARVIRERRRGYGNAYMAGINAARGEFVLMADADLTYDFAEAPHFLAEMQDGADLVVGDRMKNIHPGAMPWHHRYIGNPLLSGLLNTLFSTGVSDAHCGMRAVRRSVVPRLDLRTSGMEFASEMVIRAAKEKLDIRQFPIEYYERGGESKLVSFRDGWRHLRFLLVHAPNFLFILPGAVMGLLGALVQLIVLAHLPVFGRAWDQHAMIGGALLSIVGSQVIALGTCACAYATYYMNERGTWFARMRSRFRLEQGLMIGGATTLAGTVIGAFIVISWINGGFGSLADENLGIVAATLIIIGVQIFFTSFLLSILGLRRRG